MSLLDIDKNKKIREEAKKIAEKNLKILGYDKKKKTYRKCEICQKEFLSHKGKTCYDCFKDNFENPFNRGGEVYD